VNTLRKFNCTYHCNNIIVTGAAATKPPPPVIFIYVTEAPPSVIGLFIRVQVSHISCGGGALKFSGLLIFKRVKLVASTKKCSAVAEMVDRARAMGQNVGLPCPFPRGAASPSNTMPPGPKPTSVPSGVLVHQTIWPQYANATDRQTGQRRVVMPVTVTQKAWSPYVCVPVYGQSNEDGSQNRKFLHTRRYWSRCIWPGGSHFRCRKTTSGGETTIFGLTETANTAV